MIVTRAARAAWLSAALVACAPTATRAAPAAGTGPFVMKIALATVGDALHQFARDYAAAVARDSAGRIKPEIYPDSRLGAIEQEAEGVQFASIQCQIVPPEFLVGIDRRFGVLAAPGLVASMAQGQGLATDPAVMKLMLGLGTDKGLHGVGLFMATPAAIISRTPLRRLADFKGKKIRIFASQFQSEAMRRLGALPRPMTLGEVLPALQDNALDAAVSAIPVFTTMHYEAVARYVTEANDAAVFGIVELSARWYASLPASLQDILTRDAAAESRAIYPWAVEFNQAARKAWTARGGELIELPPAEQAAMSNILAGVGAEVSRENPALGAAYRIVAAAAARHRSGP